LKEFTGYTNLPGFVASGAGMGVTVGTTVAAGVSEASLVLAMVRQ